MTDNKDSTVIVDRTYHWRPIDENTPRGRKLQLINVKAGAAVYGVLQTDNTFFTHWAPLPTFKKD